MKMYILGTILTLILSGCATPAELRKLNPDMKLDSTRTAKVVAICIADKWENGGINGTFSVNMRLTENGYTMNVNNSGNTILVADVMGLANEQSTTIIYSRGIAIGKFLDDAKACQ